MYGTRFSKIILAKIILIWLINKYISLLPPGQPKYLQRRKTFSEKILCLCHKIFKSIIINTDICHRPNISFLCTAMEKMHTAIIIFVPAKLLFCFSEWHGNACWGVGQKAKQKHCQLIKLMRDKASCETVTSSNKIAANTVYLSAIHPAHFAPSYSPSSD